MKFEVNTPMGLFVWNIEINPDGVQLDVTPVLPQGGHGFAGSYTERIKDLLGPKYEGQRELQAFAEASIVGMHAVFLGVLRTYVDSELTFADSLDEQFMEDTFTEECSVQNIKDALHVGAGYLFVQLRQQIEAS